jgi:LysR family glycine cleavage system transcriptional activator
MRVEYLPPLNWLRAFEAAARHLSFTQAAAELNLTQAAVSKQVKHLELHLRQQLFVRLPRSLALTKTGEAYLPKVRDAFERLASGTREVFGGRDGAALTVRSAVSFAVNWLVPRLPAFVAAHPGTRLRIVSSVWSDAIDAANFDLDIQYGTGDWSGVESHRLTHETITPLCAPAFLRGAAALRRPADLKHRTLLHVIGYQEGWGTWLNAARVKDVDPGGGLQFDTSLAALEMASRGAGVALGRSSLAEKDLGSGRLVAPFELAVPIREAFYLIRPTNAAPHPAARAFIAWLLKTAAASKRQAKP